jgi:hypothetical protein
MRQFYSIEYTDLEGDLNIRHEFMTQDEVNQLQGWFTQNNIQATINRLGAIDNDHPVLNTANSININ